MTSVTLRRNDLGRLEPFSVVALAIAYAVLSIALVCEWGRIARVFEVAPSGDASNAFEVAGTRDVP